MDYKKSRTGKVFRISGSVLLFSALCALGIWAFTPVSEEADYKLVQTKNTNPVKTSARPVVTHASMRPDHHPELSKAAGVKLPPVLEAPATSQAEPQTTAVKIVETPGVPEQPPIDITSEAPRPAVKPFDLDRLLLTMGQPVANTAFSKIEQPNSSAADAIIKTEHTGRIETITIQSGDTLTRIFSRAKLPISQAIKLAQTQDASQLNRLSIGKTMRIYFDENEHWQSLQYDTDKLNTLIVTQDAGEFQIEQHEKQVEYRTFTANGVIESSLGAATESAGVSRTVTQALVDIYKWEVDFARDIRSGDTFSVVYQKAYIENEFITDGPILASSFSNNGRTIEAIRYTDSVGNTAYFQPDGESLRRGFLRTPVKLARVTSGFGKRRHPIKNTWKKHLGVDYGASRGTPILATADGVVQYAGKKGGYGNTVILRHGGIYTTLYAHMSKMGKGIRSGKAVTQGQIIGYVGSTGWATGDHLHYEFRVNGQHKNPLKVKLPRTNPLAKKEMESFTDQAQPLLGTLTALRANQLATLDSQETQPTL